MFTSGSKYFFGVALFSFLAALVYGAASGVHDGIISMIVGPLTFGYKGAVGDHVGYGILMGLALVAFFLGCVVVAFRDDNAAALAQVARTDAAPDLAPPGTTSYVPIFAAFGVAIAIVGLVTDAALFVFGLVVLVLVLVEWTVKAWSDRATGDPAVNQRIRNRMMNPVEIPVIGVIAIAFFVLAISRVLLAVPEVGADIIFGAVPALILVVAVAIANRERISKNVVVGLVVFGGLVVLVGGVVAAATGPRTFEKHKSHTTGLQEGAPPPTAPGHVTGVAR